MSEEDERAIDERNSFRFFSFVFFFAASFLFFSSLLFFFTYTFFFNSDTMLNSALASPRPLWALPSNTLRGVTHRSHATEPLLCTASLSQRYQLRQRPSIERRRRPADSSTSTPFAVCASTSSSSPSEPTPTPSNNNEARSNRATPVEGAVALVLECISLARKCDKEG